MHVLAVEYPGYGLCPGGQADGESVTENARVAFRFIREVLKWPLDGILVLGRSIGTGPALAVAAENCVYGLILISPFTSVQELCRDIIGPLAYLIDERFPNKERMTSVRSPLLLVHGRKDAVVPVTHGEKLYEVCRSRKRLVCPENMEHNTNLHIDASYFVLPMLQFYGLPDYSFEELEIPSWVYNKRMCIFYQDVDSEHTPALFGMRTWCQPSKGALKGRSRSAPPASLGSHAGSPQRSASLERNDRTAAVHNLDLHDDDLPLPPEDTGYVKVPCSRWVDSAMAPCVVYAESTTCTETGAVDNDMIGI